MRTTFVGALALVAALLCYLPTAHADVGSLDDTVDASIAPAPVSVVEIAPSADVAPFESLEGIARCAAATPARATPHPEALEHSTATDCAAGVIPSERTLSRERGAAYRRHPIAPQGTWPDG